MQLFGAGYLGPFGHFFHLILDKIFKGGKTADPSVLSSNYMYHNLNSGIAVGTLSSVCFSYSFCSIKYPLLLHVSWSI